MNKLHHHFRTILAAIFIILSFIVAFSASPSTEKTVYGKNSSELTLKDMGDGRFSYVNSAGEITYAADKHYATVERTTDEKGRIIRESYYDDFGLPSALSSGAYGYEKKYDNNQTTLTWLNANGEGFKISSGYTVSVTTQNGLVSTTRYYDSRRRKMTCTGGYWGYDDILDDTGKILSRTYVDTNGKAVTTKSGYAGFTRTYDAQKRVQTENYRDTEGDAAVLSAGHSGVFYVYDNQNRAAETRYLDADGNFMTVKDGYAGSRKTYDAAGRTDTLTYLDTEGQAVNCKNGYAMTSTTYYADNSTKTVMYQDAEGKAVRNQTGVFGLLYLDELTLNLNADGTIAVSINKVLRIYPLLVPLIGLLLCAAAAFAYRAHKCGKPEAGTVDLWTVSKSKWIRGLLFATAFAIIIYETLFNRVTGEQRFNLNLFWSYARFFSSTQMRLEILNNIWLFVPLGSCMILTARPKRNLLIVPLTTIAVEAIQYFTATGLAELDDLFHNTLGGLMGFMIVLTMVEIWESVKKRK